MKRSLTLLLTLLGGWLLAGVLVAGPASAHATLVRTDPGDGARVASAPAKVTLEFDEPVSLGAGYARVLTANGARADAGAASVHGPVVTIPLRRGLADGGYLVTYRVISADSHPVAGAYSFVVGTGSLVKAGGAASGEGSGDPLVGVAMPVVRWIGYAGLALAVGLPVLALLCWPAGWASDRMRRLTTWGVIAVGASALLGFFLQGPYAAGSGLGSLADPALLAATLGSLAGRALLVRAVVALALLALLRPVWRRGAPPSIAAAAGAGVLAVALAVTGALVGHPAAGSLPGLAVTVTTVHLLSMAVWLGGLTGLLVVVLRPSTPPEALGTVLPQFSRIAFLSMTALVVTGTLQALREVGSASALVSTEYGWVLLAKLVLVAVILGAAGLSRVWVQQRLGVRHPRPGSRRRVTAHAFAAGATSAADDADDADEATARAAAMRAADQARGAVADLPGFRRSVFVEFALAVAVLALSAVLVATPPARAATAQPLDTTLVLQGSDGPSGSVQVSIDPAQPGSNLFHLYLYDDKGQLTQPAGISVTLTEREQQIGPVPVALQPGGPGHYESNDLEIVKAGTWTLTVVVRVNEFTATTASTTFPVR